MIVAAASPGFCASAACRVAAAALAAVAFAGAASAAAPSTADLWPPAPPVGNVADVTLEGVVLGGPGGEAARVIGWDRVVRVNGELAPRAEPFLPLARDVWRARTRLERGDSPSAAPVFEALSEVLSGRRGPTSTLVAEGLLRCRLSRGASATAVAPWLAMIEGEAAAQARGAAESAFPDLPPVLDRRSGLCPQLPPMFRPGPATEQLAAADIAALSLAGDGTESRELAALYVRAARADAGFPPAGFAGAARAAGPGLRLVRDIVEARTAGPAARDAARARLSARLDRAALEPIPDWEEAWVRLALGRSLAMEPQPELALRGVVQMLHVPARFHDALPELAALATAEAADALLAAGQPQNAAALLTELRRTAPWFEAAGANADAPQPGGPTAPASPAQPAAPPAAQSPTDAPSPDPEESP